MVFIFRFMKGLSCVLAAVIISINMYFVGYYVTESLSPEWYIILAVSIFGVLYLAFCAYLILHVIASMGFSWFEGSLVRNLKFKLSCNKK